MLDFHSFSVWLNVALFVAAAAAVWLAGAKLAYYADAISERTKLSKAFLGLILLGVATSLPEFVTTITGSVLGNASLVTGNLFGGVALQIAVLALVDLIAVRRALTFFTPEPVLLFQAVMLLLLLSVAMAGAAAGDPVAVAGFGLTPVLLAAGYVVAVGGSREGATHPRWRAVNAPEDTATQQRETQAPFGHMPTRGLALYSTLSALGILAAGWCLAQTGDALAQQTGLGGSFVGATLVASSTSLPELSTALAAVRQRNYQMAVSNILGTNCLELALFFVADAFYRSGPILATADASAMFAAAWAMTVTCIYLLGLLERRNGTLLRMGYDSVAVLVVCGVGFTGLYLLR